MPVAHQSSRFALASNKSNEPANPITPRFGSAPPSCHATICHVPRVRPATFAHFGQSCPTRAENLFAVPVINLRVVMHRLSPSTWLWAFPILLSR